MVFLKITIHSQVALKALLESMDHDVDELFVYDGIGFLKTPSFYFAESVLKKYTGKHIPRSEYIFNTVD